MVRGEARAGKNNTNFSRYLKFTFSLIHHSFGCYKLLTVSRVVTNLVQTVSVSQCSCGRIRATSCLHHFAVTSFMQILEKTVWNAVFRWIVRLSQEIWEKMSIMSSYISCGSGRKVWQKRVHKVPNSRWAQLIYNLVNYRPGKGHDFWNTSLALTKNVLHSTCIYVFCWRSILLIHKDSPVFKEGCS